jgi:hypothetical protein
MSQIRTIYSNLAAQSVTFTKEAGGSVTVTAKDLDELPSAVQAADAPTRLLLPYANTTETRDGQFASLDSVGRQEWFLSDLLLWKPAPLGSGIAESAADMIRYQGAYFEMLRSFKDCGIVGGDSDVELIGWRAIPGVYDWPIGGDSWWQGVMITLQVLEVMAG